MEKITLNIFILTVIWGVLLTSAVIQAGNDDPVELDPSSMKVFQIYILGIKNEIIEAHINSLMYCLAKDKHQNRLGYPCNEPLDILPLQWGPTYRLETGGKYFLLHTKNDKDKMLMMLDFCEGYNDWTRLQQGEYSERQIIQYTQQKEKHRAKYIGDYFYAAGVNAAASLKEKDFPWGDKRFYTKKKCENAYQKCTYSYIGQERSTDPVELDHSIMKVFQYEIKEIKPEVIEAHISLLMYYLANNDHQHRLGPPCTEPLDILPQDFFPHYKLEPEGRTFLQKTENDKAKILMMLEFCEGYNDWTRQQLGECSVQQIIKHAKWKESLITELEYPGNYFYVAGVNAAASLKGKYFPWKECSFYKRDNLSQKEINEFGF